MSYLFIISTFSVCLACLIVWQRMGSYKTEFSKAGNLFKVSLFNDLKRLLKNPSCINEISPFNTRYLLGCLVGLYLFFVFRVACVSLIIFSALLGLYHLLV